MQQERGEVRAQHNTWQNPTARKGKRQLCSGTRTDKASRAREERAKDVRQTRPETGEVVVGALQDGADDDEKASNPHREPLVLCEEVRTRAHVDAVGQVDQPRGGGIAGVQLLREHLHEETGSGKQGLRALRNVRLRCV